MKFLISVIDSESNSATSDEMDNINEFNDGLRAKGYWIFAWGLQAPETASVIDNRDGANLETGKPLFGAKENFSGFWLIEVPDKETARILSFAASHACNRKVELRPLH